MKITVLNQFDHYLMNKGLSQKTRVSILKAVKQFDQWSANENIQEVNSATFADILLYIKKCSSAGNARKTISLKVLFLRHFYDFVMQEGQIQENPATGI